MRVETSLLDVEVGTAGPEDGPVILLLHGWPDDATTWDGVARPLRRRRPRLGIQHMRAQTSRPSKPPAK